MYLNELDIQLLAVAFIAALIAGALLGKYTGLALNYKRLSDNACLDALEHDHIKERLRQTEHELWLAKRALYIIDRSGSIEGADRALTEEIVGDLAAFYTVPLSVAETGGSLTQSYPTYYLQTPPWATQEVVTSG